MSLRNGLGDEASELLAVFVREGWRVLETGSTMALNAQSL